ncbi:hypothetical protein L3X38_006123 [Prunus dulcis]|uniref:Sulfhydryl oxidase n=1 Tax=Prunus dulcis TaxID=3755 RepID=A0AAD4ZS36_PRUDU|nr:hypothetical protein L3X38_006123 [Prunus dulcis]
MSRALWLLILSLFSLTFTLSASSSSWGSRSILRAVNTDNADVHDYAVELNATNFDEVLRDTPASFAVVEFFAHWCPACRNYKPQYEKVARLFNGPDAVHPGIILMTRVDCASKINTKLCDNFSVADRLLSWINKQTGSSFALDDQKFENEHLSSNVSDPGQIARAVYDVEEATSTAFEIILGHKMIKSNTRASLVKFLQLLVAHHPSRRCRKGSAEVLVNFDDLCPLDMWSADRQGDQDVQAALGNFQICGRDVPRGYWMFCRGSKNDTRGFSCGLWVLLHSLSVRIEDGESNFAFTTICDFVHNFFICEECRRHFYDMCSSVYTPFNKSRDFALWLWIVHSERLLATGVRSKRVGSQGEAGASFVARANLRTDNKVRSRRKSGS